MTYGYEISWTEFNGNKHTIGVSKCRTAIEAIENTKRIAIDSGWKPKKWWQWWRWGDTNPDVAYNNALATDPESYAVEVDKLDK